MYWTSKDKICPFFLFPFSFSFLFLKSLCADTIETQSIGLKRGVSKAVPWLAWLAQVQKMTGTSERDYAALLWLPVQLSRNLCTTGYMYREMIRWWEYPSPCRCWWASLQVASHQVSSYKQITCFYQRHSEMRLSVPYVNTYVSQCSLEALWKLCFLFSFPKLSSPFL